MGVYINPTDGSSKEDWLAANGTLLGKNRSVTETEYNENDAKGNLFVVNVHNGAFTAAAVAFDYRELQAFAPRPDDHRPARLWTIPKKSIRNGSGVSEKEILHYNLAG